MISMPRKVIIGNWKMNQTQKDALEFVRGFLSSDPIDPRDWVGLAVPYTLIAPLTKEIEGKETTLHIGAQNMNDCTRGSFTGEIAAFMLEEVGSQFVLLGHSERRHIFGEDDAFIHRKLVRACASSLLPVLCVGETEQERSEGLTFEVIERQITKALKDISIDEVKDFMMAYEPVWAVGTGTPATVEVIQEVHSFCRSILEKTWNSEKAAYIPILYGGSVTSNNASRYLEQEEINGLLIGGASLSLESFLQIVNDNS